MHTAEFLAVPDERLPSWNNRGDFCDRGSCVVGSKTVVVMVLWPKINFWQCQKYQDDLTAIRTYFMRWLIRTTSLVQIHTIFAKSYVFYELQNSYEFVRMTYT